MPSKTLNVTLRECKAGWCRQCWPDPTITPGKVYINSYKCPSCGGESKVVGTYSWTPV